MAIIPGATQFIGISPEIDLTEKKSSRLNSETQPYTLNDIKDSVAATPAGSTGQVQFNNAGALGASSNLFWDNTNSRLGIGTSNPTSTLQVNGTTAVNGQFDVTNGTANFRVTNDITSYVSLNYGSTRWMTYNASETYFQSSEFFAQGGSNFRFAGNGIFGTTSNLGARLGIRGSGSTSATTSLLVQNSGGVANATFRDNGEVSLILDRTGKGLELIDNLALTQSSRYYQKSGVSQVTTSQPILNYFCWSNGTQEYPIGVFAYDSGRFIISDTQKNLNSAGAASAVLQADSTTKGFLPPRMTEAQILAIASPAIGLMAYNTDKDCPVFYSAAGWRKVSHSAM